MVKKDLPDVVKVEQSAFGEPWGDDEFKYYLKKRNCIGKVATYNEKIVGFVVYEVNEDSITILNMAVDYTKQRRKIGTEIIKHVQQKIGGKREKITVVIRETNLDAQLFFKAMGFKALSVIRDFYADITEDAYLMEYEKGVFA
jgi:ribosomal-protein-alanine N-acetyltransferase